MNIQNRSFDTDQLSFLHQLNAYLEEYISSSIEESNDLGPFPAIEKLKGLAEPNNCWVVNDCHKVDCVSHGKTQERCWLTTGTLCDGLVEGSLAEKLGSCMKCKVYAKAHNAPHSALIENINVLLFHLNSKAQNLRDMAIHDGLTGLYNRQFFDEVIDREIAAAKRRNEKFGLFVIDVDKFKTLNDTLGHMAGDMVLKSIGEILSASVRKTDLVFRFGGDEFVVLLTSMHERRLDRTLKRINTATEDWNAEASPSHWTLGLSIGAVMFDPCSQKISEALEDADRNMYLQKAQKG